MIQSESSYVPQIAVTHGVRTRSPARKPGSTGAVLLHSSRETLHITKPLVDATTASSVPFQRVLQAVVIG
jgi:hypothetical protein